MHRCSYCPFLFVHGVCRGCGKALVGRQRAWCSEKCSSEYTYAHYWSSARERALQRDGRRCVTCGSTKGLEVNHIDPRNGRGYGFGCWNHLENLETLCHDCHVKVTNQQAADRRASEFAQEAMV